MLWAVDTGGKREAGSGKREARKVEVEVEVEIEIDGMAQLTLCGTSQSPAEKLQFPR